MKKIYSLLLFAFVAVAANAQVYYLLPATDKSASDVTNTDLYLTEEKCGDNVVSPERRAYSWFISADGYNSTNSLTIKDVKEGKLLTSSVRVLWVNVDEVGLTTSDFDSKFDETFVNKLAEFVKNGGNIFLTKQAGRLVYKMGRCTYEPNFANGGYATNVSDTWYQMYHFDCSGNKDNHYSMSQVTGKEKFQIDSEVRFPLTSGENPYYRTDNNCGWGDFTNYAVGTEGTDLQKRRDGFENANTCKILGGWGHTRYIDYAGTVEFYPTGDWKGTVFVQGLAAYQWGPQNTSESNVKNFTKGTLDYLQGEGHWDADEHPEDGYVGDGDKYVVRSNYSGYYVTYNSSNTDVAAFGASGNDDWWDCITFKKAGTTTITATFVGDGEYSCKTPLYISTDITVLDNWKKVGANNVTVDRGFTANTNSTVCFPFALSADQCSTLGQFYAFTKVDEDGLHFTPVTSTEANVPYLFVPSADIPAPATFSNVEVVATATAETTVGNYTFTGVYETTPLENAYTNGNYAYTTDGVFATTKGTITVNPTRCYMHYTGSGAAKLNITFDDETTTNINDVNGSTSVNAPIYNISGVRVSNATKGVFIQNGKKFVK